MSKIGYAGSPSVKPTRRPYAGISPRPENQSVRYLRRLRAWVAGTHDMTPADLLDKIDDLLFQARGGK